MNGRIVFDNDQLKSQHEEVTGQNEFTFWTVIAGMFGDLKSLSEMINDAEDIPYVKIA